VPGGIYSDLRGAGILPEEIYYRFNDHAYRWVGDDTWTFTRQFTGLSTSSGFIRVTQMQYNHAFCGSSKPKCGRAKHYINLKSSACL
jgi:hypothetical protein